MAHQRRLKPLAADATELVVDSSAVGDTARERAGAFAELRLWRLQRIGLEADRPTTHART